MDTTTTTLDVDADVVVPTGVLIEAAAELFAIGSRLHDLNGHQDTPTQTRLGEGAVALLAPLAGDSGSGNFYRHPAVVEAMALASEINEDAAMAERVRSKGWALEAIVSLAEWEADNGR